MVEQLEAKQFTVKERKCFNCHSSNFLGYEVPSLVVKSLQNTSTKLLQLQPPKKKQFFSGITSCFGGMMPNPTVKNWWIEQLRKIKSIPEDN